MKYDIPFRQVHACEQFETTLSLLGKVSGIKINELRLDRLSALTMFADGFMSDHGKANVIILKGEDRDARTGDPLHVSPGHIVTVDRPPPSGS